MNQSIFIFALSLLVACQPQSQAPEVNFSDLPLSEQHKAENALLSFETHPELEVSLFASEPMMINPTNMDIDHRGRVWICEARNYRLPFNPAHEARAEGDRILILEDTDGDGQADRHKVFYQGNDVNAALGICVLGNQVIVSASPNIFVFTDTDGDDIADEKELLFSQIKGVDDDHGVHAFVYGPDGRLYFNFGNNGNQIRDAEVNPILDKFGKEVQAHGQPYRQGMAFRCNPDGSNLEVLGYNFRNIYELSIDSYGNIFQSDNDDDGNKGVRINFIIEYGNYGYQDQLTGAGWRQRRVGMHEEIPYRHWHQNDPGVIPNMLFTGSGSPAGMTFYEGNLLPEVFHHQVIHAEPGHQVVRAYITEKDGAGYKASIVNLLQSADKWFRPSDVCIAPDGSIFIADWHDAVVGGNGMVDIQRGRIFRLAPDVSSYEVPTFDFETLEGAIEAIKNPNLSTRYLAWQKLHAAGPKAKSFLESLASQTAAPHLAARAYWLLGQLPEEGENYVQQLLEHPNEDFRIQGIRMARMLQQDELQEVIKPLTADPSPQVRREVAIALKGHCNLAAIDNWLALLDHHEVGDRWSLEALGLPTDDCADSYFKAWLDATPEWNSPTGREIIWRVHSKHALPLMQEILKEENILQKDFTRFLRSLHFIDHPDKYTLLAEVLELVADQPEKLKAIVLAADPAKLPQHPHLAGIIRDRLSLIEGSPEWFDVVAALKINGKKEQLWGFVTDNSAPEQRRSAASLLVSLGEMAFLRTKLSDVDSDEYLDLIRLFGSNADMDMIHFLAEEMNRPDLDLNTKRGIVESLGNSWNGQHFLYDEIKKDRLDDPLKLTAAAKLMNCWDTKIRNEAPAILASLQDKPYDQVPDIVSLSRESGEARDGKQVFKIYCTACHQVDGEGIRFGPDLSEIGKKLSRRGLYEAIILPGASINYGYEGVLVTLNDGSKWQGYIESKTDEGIQLRIPSGESKTFMHTEIAQSEMLTQSLMTEGLHQAMSNKELVDLVSYLEALGQEDKNL